MLHRKKKSTDERFSPRIRQRPLSHSGPFPSTSSEPKEEEALFSGYMYKLKLGKRRMSQWRTRYFVLRGHFLSYAASPADRPKGHIDIRRVEVSEHVADRHEKTHVLHLSEVDNERSVLLERRLAGMEQSISMLSTSWSSESLLNTARDDAVQSSTSSSPSSSSGSSSGSAVEYLLATDTAEDLRQWIDFIRFARSRGLRESDIDVPEPALQQEGLKRLNWVSSSSMVKRERTPTPEVVLGGKKHDVRLNTGKSVYEGWLVKKHVKAELPLVVSSSKGKDKKLYFVLGVEEVAYFKVKHKATIEIEAGDDITDEPNPVILQKNIAGYEFTVNKKDKSVRLAVTSDLEQREWVSALRAAASAVGDDNVKEGMVMVMDVASKKWRPRHCILRNAQLDVLYREAKGVVSLIDALVERLSPTVFLLARVGEVMHLECEDAEVCSKWLLLLRQEIECCQVLDAVRGRADRTDSVSSNMDQTKKELAFRQRIEEVMRDGRRAYEETIAAAPLCSPPKKNQLFILSVDGGGMRGLMSCIILERLLAAFPLLLKRVGFVAGCSNGAMIATALAYGIPPSVSRTLMETTGPVIFGNPSSKLNNMRQAKFDNKWLKVFCDTVWPGYKMEEAEKPLLVPTFKLKKDVPIGCTAWSPEMALSFSKEYDVKESPSIILNIRTSVRGGHLVTFICSETMRSTLASDVVMRTVAAPTYFPTYQGYIDGSLYDHDPAASALTVALSPQYLNHRLEDIVLLSIGTGHVPRHVDGDELNWGMAQWIPKLTGVLWDGMVMKSEETCRMLLGDRYMRINPIMPEEIPMDDPKQVPELTSVARNMDLTEPIRWVMEHVFSSGE